MMKRQNKKLPNRLEKKQETSNFFSFIFFKDKNKFYFPFFIFFALTVFSVIGFNIFAAINTPSSNYSNYKGLNDVLQTDPDASTFLGNIRFAGRFCLSGDCRGTWPLGSLYAKSVKTVTDLPTCTIGDIVYSTTDGKNYVCTATNTWSSFSMEDSGSSGSGSGGSSSGSGGTTTTTLHSDNGTGGDVSPTCNSSSPVINSGDIVSGYLDTTSSDTSDCYRLSSPATYGSATVVVLQEKSGLCTLKTGNNPPTTYDSMSKTLSGAGTSTKLYLGSSTDLFIAVGGGSGAYQFKVKTEEPTCKISQFARSGTNLKTNYATYCADSYYNSSYAAHWAPALKASLQSSESYLVCSSANPVGWTNDPNITSPTFMDGSAGSCLSDATGGKKQFNCTTKDWNTSPSTYACSASNYFYCCNYQ